MRSRPRVLVADADEDNRQLLMYAAEQCGYRAWGTATQAATTTMLTETHFDVVVLDSWMAASHTAQLLAGIKAGPRRPPVVAVSTGGAQPHDAVSMLAAGADLFVGKPFRLAAVRRELRRLRGRWS